MCCSGRIYVAMAISADSPPGCARKRDLTCHDKCTFLTFWRVTVSTPLLYIGLRFHFADCPQLKDAKKRQSVLEISGLPLQPQQVAKPLHRCCWKEIGSIGGNGRYPAEVSGRAERRIPHLAPGPVCGGSMGVHYLVHGYNGGSVCQGFQGGVTDGGEF